MEKVIRGEGDEEVWLVERGREPWWHGDGLLKRF